MFEISRTLNAALLSNECLKMMVRCSQNSEVAQAEGSFPGMGSLLFPRDPSSQLGARALGSFLIFYYSLGGKKDGCMGKPWLAGWCSLEISSFVLLNPSLTVLRTGAAFYPRTKPWHVRACVNPLQEQPSSNVEMAEPSQKDLEPRALQLQRPPLLSGRFAILEEKAARMSYLTCGSPNGHCAHTHNAFARELATLCCSDSHACVHV
ncbi:hypothetical protein QQF64_032442 [Cirrhinus molitorella]|uniref:Uncharacterized protein n=1 Tax=Cirrhinus molitorella TaxID=172907 RepID=A0ABR3MZS6_9TELE